VIEVIVHLAILKNQAKADQVWFPGEAISMGIGQGPITVTPLQQAHIAAEIAERGQVIATPRLVSATRAAGSNDIVARKPQMMKPLDVATSEQWDVIFDGMVGAVTRGTASPFLVKPVRYPLAGKTGTAQLFTIKQTDSTRAKISDERRRDHAWFIAFAPVDDPKIAIAVLVENGGFGGSTAAPIAQKVLDAYLLGPDATVDETKKVPKKAAL
jgi:penicillin-binding protein 2